MSDSEELEIELPLQPEILKSISSACLWIGLGTLKYSHLRILSVIRKYAAFIDAAGGNLTYEDLTESFGIEPSNAVALAYQFDGLENMAGVLPIIIELEEYLPHPRNDNIVLPLFVALTVMTTIAVALRMWSRYKVAGSIQSFDYLTGIAYAMTVAWGAVAVYHSFSNGPYSAFWDMSWDTLRRHYRINFTLNIFYPWVMLFIKMSLCVFYYKMTALWYIRWGIWATGAVTVGNTIAGFFTPIFSCRPILYWDHLLEGPCKADRRMATIIIGAIYILTDIAIWALPMPLIFQLKLYPRQRILALCTFGIGAIACVASGFRLDAVIKFYNYGSEGTSTLIIDAWTIIEMNIALLCACAPAVRALVIYYAPKMFPNLFPAPTKGSSQDTKTNEPGNTKAGSKITSTAEKV
ncbi:hypothetical protein TWF730_006072 [Orbilia blumenaviensis]|uniref:Rhodopsin domain-containing protein n=1 Tax=Orbilia blumenaviensis TaxID=1796055 RepID=A0AAV9VLL8_9PEZI